MFTKSSNKGSLKEISEISKPLSPMTSQNLTPKDQAFDYKPDLEKSDSKPGSSKKNNVTFKEEGHGEEEGALPPASSHSRRSNNKDLFSNTGSIVGNKNSSSKIVSILKNSRQSKLSVSIKDDSSEVSNQINDVSKGDPNYLNVTNNPKKNTKKIPNMKVEEDQVNLSDLGTGPDKPEIKRILTKKKTVVEKPEKEPKPSPVLHKSKAKVKDDKDDENEEEEESSENEEDLSSSEDLDETISKDYVMKSELFDYNELSQSGYFKIKKYKDAVYRGEINPKTKMRHGTGVMEYDNGRVYEGEWKEDLRNGSGYELYANGNNYLGEFKSGKADGRGVYNWANGEFYNGDWVQGQKHGYGEWKSSDSETYIGYWKEGKASGQG